MLSEWELTGGGVGLGGLFAMVITVNLCSESKNLASIVSFLCVSIFLLIIAELHLSNRFEYN